MVNSDLVLEVADVDYTWTDTEDISEVVSASSAEEAAEADQTDASSVELSADSVSIGDSSGASEAGVSVVVEPIDTTSIEQYLASIDERLERVEAYTVSAGDYMSYESTAFIGSDIESYTITDGLLLIVFIGVVVSALLNKWRY